MRDLLIPKDNMSSKEYLELLADGKHLTDICNKMNINTSLKKFIVDENASAIFKKYMTNVSSLSKDEVIKLAALQNLFKYIETSFTLCPSCGEIMSASWGWCPYHATAKDLKTWNVTDENNDGEIKDDFINSRIGGKSIGEHMQSPYEGKNYSRALVHWTEFLIVK